MHSKKKILFYVGHPAHYHNIRNLAARLEKKGFSVLVVAREKDVLFRLLENCPFETILIGGAAGHSRLHKAAHLFNRELQMIAIARKHKPMLMMGTDMIITHVGKLLGIPSFILNEDDAEAVPLFARLAYPMATGIFCPSCCSVGKYTNKKIGYAGYHELAYLHPDYFTPERSRIETLFKDNKPYYLLRFVDLTAHHDVGKKGIHKELALRIIQLLSEKGTVYISSERKLEPEFESYRIAIHPQDIHHALYYADLFLGDSQTMTAEAAVLGTSSLRFNDFVGKLAYLDELEHRWQLTFGFTTNREDLLLMKVRNCLLNPI
jgi:predicted glycosyltransferase